MSGWTTTKERAARKSHLTQPDSWRCTGPAEYYDRSATSEGWHVQWELVPPGQESEPRSLGCIRGGNEPNEAN